MTRLHPIANDLRHAAENMLNAIIQPFSDALYHLEAVRKHADGYGTANDDEGGRTVAELTPTERAANIRYNVGAQIQEARDHVHAFHGLNHDLTDLIRSMWGHERHIAHGQPAPTLCYEGQRGKEGVVEWGDPGCDRAPDKAGMCHAHYMDWYRFRKRNGIDTSRDFAA